jgi:acetyl esterase/lipase
MTVHDDADEAAVRDACAWRAGAFALVAMLACAALAGCAGPPLASPAAPTRGVGAPAATRTAPAAPAGKPNVQMQAVLDQLVALGGEPIVNLGAPAARAQPTPADAVRELLRAQGRSTAPEVVARVEFHHILGADATAMPVRVYWPDGEGPHPVLVYFHDGGWVLGDAELGDASARALSNAARAIVVAPHYRQGPEHRYPAAHDDAFAAYRWTQDNAVHFGGDPARIAVAGEGAGGNLAASVAIRARDQRVAPPVHQLLVYPITDVSIDTLSHRQHADARPLGTPMLPWLFSHYLRSPVEGADPKFSILRTAELSGLPAATVITADIDPLRTQGQAYAERLRAAGVAVEHRNFEGVCHGFFGMGSVVREARQAQELAAAGLRRSFGVR